MVASFEKKCANSMKLLRKLKKAVEGTPLAAIYRAARDEWQWARSSPVQTPFGYQLCGRQDMQNGAFEPEETALIRNYLNDADVFVDVGANIGYFACLSRSMGKHTIAVEPLPDNLRYLMANLAANGWNDDVEVYPVGLGDRPTLAWLYGSGTASSLLTGWAGASPRFRRMIPLSTLDILLGCRFQGKRMVIKIDVEGAEHSVLLGGLNILQASPRPTWLVEVTLTENRLPGSSNPHFLNTFELMWAHGYQARSVGPNSREISCKELRDYAITDQRPEWSSGNYVFTGND
jgi:FkbM family methyltransferase